MKAGDLVKINIQKEHVPGALTAIKYVMALEKEYGGLLGLVVDTYGDYASIRFPNGLKMVEKKFVEIINESR